MGPNRPGMLPEHSQTLLGHFWEKLFFTKHDDLFVILHSFAKIGQILFGICRGCPPSTARHFWVIFGKSHFGSKILKTDGKSWKRPRAGKPFLFLEIMGIKKTRIATT